MKKLLTLLGISTLTISAASTLVACGPTNENQENENQENEIILNELFKVKELGVINYEIPSEIVTKISKELLKVNNLENKESLGRFTTWFENEYRSLFWGDELPNELNVVLKKDELAGFAATSFDITFELKPRPEEDKLQMDQVFTNLDLGEIEIKSVNFVWIDIADKLFELNQSSLDNISLDSSLIIKDWLKDYLSDKKLTINDKSVDVTLLQNQLKSWAAGTIKLNFNLIKK